MEPTSKEIKKAKHIVKKENIEARKNSNGEVVRILRRSELDQLAYDKAVELKNQNN